MWHGLLYKSNGIFVRTGGFQLFIVPDKKRRQQLTAREKDRTSKWERWWPSTLSQPQPKVYTQGDFHISQSILKGLEAATPSSGHIQGIYYNIDDRCWLAVKWEGPDWSCLGLWSFWIFHSWHMSLLNWVQLATDINVLLQTGLERWLIQ